MRLNRVARLIKNSTSIKLILVGCQNKAANFLLVCITTILLMTQNRNQRWFDGIIEHLTRLLYVDSSTTKSFLRRFHLLMPFHFL